MPAKAIREYHAKSMFERWVEAQREKTVESSKYIQITPDVKDWEALKTRHPWVETTRLVVKPDQLIKRRGKAQLLLLNADYQSVTEWIESHREKEVIIGTTRGKLTHFLIEPFLPHEEKSEYYLCILSTRKGEEILFYSQGGINVGDIDTKASRLKVNLNEDSTTEEIQTKLLNDIISVEQKQSISEFIQSSLKCYRELNFVYMEMNPFILTDKRAIPLDMAVKVDSSAEYLCRDEWGEDLEFPPSFGRTAYPEEQFIEELDSKTGASLKLTILNPKGRIWTMVAGGGASVIYADTICDLGYGSELANYGEYSGAPDCEATYQYAKTIFDLATREYDERGKVIIIGGGIANFTDVAETFQGIILAIKAYQEKLKKTKSVIWVRRGGPNYQEGLRLMGEVGNATGVSMHVYGPETHMTAIVPMALGLKTDEGKKQERVFSSVVKDENEKECYGKDTKNLMLQDNNIVRFTKNTRCIVYGLQTRAVQGMLDFDYLCKREMPSVAALVFPFSSNHYLKFYWGTSERLIPVYQSIEEAIEQFPEVSVMINYASFRSVFSTTMEALRFDNVIKTHAIIAEGVAESQARIIIEEARKRNVGIIGPATVGGIKPGCFRIGNSGGMIDNILHSRLYRPGSIAYVSKSGGMSNELNNIISLNGDGVFEGVAIGGDRYPGSTFIDHILRYEANPGIKMIVLLGEIGGTDEYAVCDALQRGLISKPLVAWCIGTCVKMFTFDVQFGHAGACANGQEDTATAKNAALLASGAIVPSSFDGLGDKIRATFEKLVAAGSVVLGPEEPVPSMPMDYERAKNLGLVRKPANFISTISDERGEELKYAGMPISDIFEKNMGLGSVIGLLWFKCQLPDYAVKFIEMVLMVTADHGPAVSGAHNTIVTARAGKDLISSLVSGLLTIGPRFGGALDAAAKTFSEAYDSGISPREFVEKMRKEKKLIMGIGHRVKSLTNPDKRVSVIREFAEKNFPSNNILHYATKVEKITTAKKSNLILNVDGCIAVCFVDLLRGCGSFTSEQVAEHLENGCLNGLFVLGRSIGFIGHFLDQKRLKQPLYRHPWDDISYLSGNN